MRYKLANPLPGDAPDGLHDDESDGFDQLLAIDPDEILSKDSATLLANIVAAAVNAAGFVPEYRE